VRYAIFLSLAVVLNAGSSLFYKYSSQNGSNRTLSLILLAAGLTLGAINATLYTASLKGIKLSVAYPVFSAGSLILVSALSLLVFRESLTPRRIAGIGMLVAGVAAISA
jgi:multidrug transporter EmrE-like cation transporter